MPVPRAQGRCERCGSLGTLCDAVVVNRTWKFTIYLRLADDGPDDIFHVAAICPNCHREAHYGVDPRAFQVALRELVAGKEQFR